MGILTFLSRVLFTRGGISALGRAGTNVIGAIRPNATRQMELGHDAFSAVQAEHAAEFQSRSGGWFDSLVNGLNRLPRPFLAMGTLGLFVYAMVDPLGFSERMAGLAHVPDAMWWLLGAVVAFYFGARETHHLRAHRAPGRSASLLPDAVSDASSARASATPAPATPAPTGPAPANPALEAWRSMAEDANVERD